ncbi:MAG: hypothetical protein U0T83_10895 [Bacteriovoracaceae bacterium]
MKFLYKLEDAITNGSAKFFGTIVKILGKLTPKKIADIVLRIQEKFKKKENLSLNPAKPKFNFKILLVKFKEKLAALHLKDKLLAFKTSSVEKLSVLKKSPPKELAQMLSTGVKNKAAELQKRLLLVNPQSIVIFIAVSLSTAIVAIKLVGVLFKTQQDVKAYREIAGQKDALNPDQEDYNSDENVARRKYRKLTTKFYKLTMIKFPVVRKDTYDMSYLYFNLNLVTSNRNTILYLTNHMLEVQDHFINNIEPIPGDFVMDDEGKRVIKDKIRDELNNFMKKNGFNGGVDDVQVEGFTGF